MIDLKKVVLFGLALLIGLFAFGAPRSTIFLSVGPSISSNFTLNSAVQMDLEFWVAKVEAYFSTSIYAGNNTIFFTPYASQLFKYVDFDWNIFKVEYGATSTHSNSFLTPWDVGTLPGGWSVFLNGKAGNNELSFAYDRGTYFARLKSFIYLDTFWYENAFLMITKLGPVFLITGKSGNAYGVGIAGNYGNFSNTLIAFSDSINLFPNVEYQTPSRYAWISSYKVNDLSLSFAMTEKELEIEGQIPFEFLNGNVMISFSGYYVSQYQPIYGIGGYISYTKPISSDLDLFVDIASNGNLIGIQPPSPVLWTGMKWRF
ncbi:hypothetical protein [Athalassotoga saccharophila]|uniref:hypothetical protein n=1 Tax=Athalassotoga saccharophila TaxID=1441386 RepID=UPI0013798741|nr:hypothetical protein [Athalassotoga saccharophila]BBJ28842.1 hypothetical protein ATHSA_1764 [Athalassotoga saccharophila]